MRVGAIEMDGCGCRSAVFTDVARIPLAPIARASPKPAGGRCWRRCKLWILGGGCGSRVDGGKVGGDSKAGDVVRMLVRI